MYLYTGSDNWMCLSNHYRNCYELQSYTWCLTGKGNHVYLICMWNKSNWLPLWRVSGLFCTLEHLATCLLHNTTTSPNTESFPASTRCYRSLFVGMSPGRSSTPAGSSGDPATQKWHLFAILWYTFSRTTWPKSKKGILTEERSIFGRGHVVLLPFG